jgi:FMN phosphatase YigB (HAD superfamily)
LSAAAKLAHKAVMAVLLLDVMDTLVWDPFRLLPQHFNLSWQELLRDKHPTAWERFERGELSHAEFCATFFRDGRGVDPDQVRDLLRASYRWLDGVPQLRAAGHELHALSNYPEWYQWIEAELGLSRWVAWTFVSCRTGVRKPDPRAYTRAAAQLNQPPSALWFIDDRLSNVEAARAVGMRGLVFQGAASLRQALQLEGLLRDA